jgi:hypothetical protein
MAEKGCVRRDVAQSRPDLYSRMQAEDEEDLDMEMALKRTGASNKTLA